MSEPFDYDVFLSHSATDKVVVREIAKRLRTDGLRVWFDEWVLKPGDCIPAKIEEGLERSRVLVLCMSAHAFGSEWAQLESGTFRFRDPLNKDRRFLPLRLDDAPIEGSLAQFHYVDWRAEDRKQGYAKLFEACQNPLASCAHRMSPKNSKGQHTANRTVAVSIKPMRDQQTPRPVNIVSNHQSGGITAHTVNLMDEDLAARIRALETEAKEAEEAQAKKNQGARQITLYQDGKNVGTADSPTIDEEKGMVSFGKIVVTVMLRKGSLLQYSSYVLAFERAEENFITADTIKSAGMEDGTFKGKGVYFKIVGKHSV